MIISCCDEESYNVEKVIAALDAVKKAGVKLQIDFNRRFDHNFKKVKDTVIRGQVGDVNIVKVTSRDPAPPPIEYVKVSGGMFLDMTIHDFDMVRYLTGSEVKEFCAAVLEDKETPVVGMDGLRSIFIGLAAKKSVAENRPVKLSEIEAEWD